MRTDIYNEWIRGKTIESCAILNKDVFCFVSGWSLMKDIEKSNFSNYYFVHHLLDESSDKGAKFKGDSRRRMAANHEDAEIIMIARGGNIFCHDTQGGRSENMVSRDDILDLRAIRYIGKHFYLAGGIRRVLRREGPDKWTNISLNLPNKNDPDKDILSFGFYDIDGFNESDIYAVGGVGDVWHFNGKNWSVINIPIDSEIDSVCCTSRGEVLIGGIGHLILRGRGNNWEVIHLDDTYNVFQQIAELNNRVFAIDEWGSKVFEIIGNKVAPMDTGGFEIPPTSCVCMATGHGMLLTAGSESACLFDGKKWRILF